MNWDAAGLENKEQRLTDAQMKTSTVRNTLQTQALRAPQGPPPCSFLLNCEQMPRLTPATFLRDLDLEDRLDLPVQEENKQRQRECFLLLIPGSPLPLSPPPRPRSTLLIHCRMELKLLACSIGLKSIFSSLRCLF